MVQGHIKYFLWIFSSLYQLVIQPKCSPTHFGQMYFTQKSCVTKIQKFAPGFCQGSLHVTKKRRVTVWLCGVQTRLSVSRKSCLNSTQSNFCNLLQKNFKESYKQNFSGQERWPLSICRCWGNWKSIKIHYQHSNIILSPTKSFESSPGFKVDITIMCGLSCLDIRS